MKLFDKLKNALFEEEYVEVEEEEKPRPKKKDKAPIAKKIELPERKKETVPPRVIREEKEEVVEVVKEETTPISDRELLKPEGNFKFPMAFEEEDFLEEKVKEPPKVVPKPVREERPIYAGKEPQIHTHSLYEKKEEKKVFRPSPIISPIYGVLDRNYTTDDIVTKRDVYIRSSYGKKMDLDAVREKAYGDLATEISLSMGEKKKKVEEVKEPDISEDNLLLDMRDEETTPVVNKVTVGDAEEYFQDLGLEYNVDYKDESKEKATGRRVSREIQQEEVEEETVPVQKKTRRSSENDENTLEDNLFDLIDSMYEEKE